MTRIPVINCTADASGAWEAGCRQEVVVIVDIIDMSTTMEAALEAGALRIYGASPDRIKAPVPVDPEAVGRKAGLTARQLQAPVVLVAEPRWGSAWERKASCPSLIRGLKLAGVNEYHIVPNLGITTAKLVNFAGSVVIAATNSGGVAFDAAWNAGGICLSATVARTWQMKGTEPACTGVDRALSVALKMKRNISFVAASSRSQEDVLAAQYLTQLAMSRRPV